MDIRIENKKINELVPSDYNPRLDLQPGDPFGGSGSTLIACEQTGRSCHMMEYDPVYADVIIRRWETFTGQKAVRLS